MPNWCNNTVTLRHDNPEMINRAYKAILDGKFLNEFIPVPDELVNTTAPNRDNADAMIEKYGYADWYDFCVAQWGTKWDFGSEAVEKDGDNTLIFCGDTAWGPPVNAYAALVKMGFEIEAFYNEPGMCFVGKVTTDHGELFDDYFDYSDENSNTVREYIGEELDDYYGISDSMAEWEDENEEDPDCE